MATKATPVAVKAASTQLYIPLVRESDGDKKGQWFMAGKRPYVYASEAEAQGVAEKTASNPDNRKIVVFDE
jgi:hypothetical protein